MTRDEEAAPPAPARRPDADRGRAGGADGHQPDRALFDRGDDEFHLGIATASHNRFLVAAVREARRLQRRPNVIGVSGAVGGHAAHAVAVHLGNTPEDCRREIRRRLFGS
ncbi:hypothetical protein [Amycolatopsis sp. WQ 127309]|uniref:hypothetical protein n=1 Tax=Amycolatopsis sp. WQ 127309 TaxID=2932773 RepID=UPI001FF1FA36|nr:hypothetical protein [Amycolatopsis sp. WQ 127309]UOZ05464.1 hypothetical protein MUY22_42635 [Amycolatopsis sp. WQ 127309]